MSEIRKYDRSMLQQLYSKFDEDSMAKEVARQESFISNERLGHGFILVLLCMIARR